MFLCAVKMLNIFLDTIFKGRNRLFHSSQPFVASIKLLNYWVPNNMINVTENLVVLVGSADFEF